MNRLIIAIPAAAILLSSCGTGKKLETANQQIQSLNGQVATLNQQHADDQKVHADDQKVIDQLKTQNLQYGREAEDCRKMQAARAKRLDNLNRNLAEHGTSMEELRAKASAALGQFRDAGAEISYKNGMVFISMNKLLFPPGSTTISDEGRQALSVVADVLADYPGVTATIIGDTDSLAIRRSFTDNFSLSTERANAIVRILRDNYQVDPVRLTAAGRGRYHPVADNATAGGRARNRRIDIILNPDLSRIWAMMENPD